MTRLADRPDRTETMALTKRLETYLLLRPGDTITRAELMEAADAGEGIANGAIVILEYSLVLVPVVVSDRKRPAAWIVADPHNGYSPGNGSLAARLARVGEALIAYGVELDLEADQETLNLEGEELALGEEGSEDGA